MVFGGNRPAPDVTSAQFMADPYGAYAVLRAEFPLAWNEPTNSYLLSRFEDVERALKDPAFTNRNYEWQAEPVHGRTIIQMDGREHSTKRALVSPSFRGRELFERFLPVIERNADELMERIPAAGPFDLVDTFATRLPINVIVDILGLPQRDHDLFHGWYSAIVAFVSNLVGDPAVTAAGVRAKEELAAYLLPVVAARRESPGDDLISTLCAAEVDGVAMTDEEIKAFASLLLTAGGETTDKAITVVVRNLLDHPDQLAAVGADPSLIDRALVETLRFSPVVQMVMRQPSVDIEMTGGTVPANSTVICLLASANRDESRFERPDEFDLHRPEIDGERGFTAAASHTAFGLGRHFCVGAHLARAEVGVSVRKLLAVGSPRYAPGFTPQDTGAFVRAPSELVLELS
ncbi:cytochrome P450 [Pseudofrankia inefficax]|uniref:Cytochrome P450 n=1 Tax=Pseudofrankia inefficax (strain DSM 45817 / CECT 9037 / DDB 130130 / EuI1c) TaxID=298654 RepID=E3JCT5_PSEI1|nr:cytochrome P450 [Pseudofrankia inefficax]ADP79925.1 cytochrome P450 [Pseudofrankia inefficax]